MGVPISTGVITDFGTTKEFGLGRNFTDHNTGKSYAYIYNAGADTMAAGDIVGIFKTTPAQGHVSTTAATMTDNGTAGIFAGVAVSAIPTVNYGWIQVAGYCANATTDAGVTQGATCVMDGGTTVGKVLDIMVDGEEECICFIADAADTAAVGTGYLLNSVLKV